MIALWLSTLALGQDLLIDDLVPGDLAISEVMQNPDAAADADGEWFEITNTSGLTMDLQGLVVADLGTDMETITTSLPVPVGGRVVIATSGDTLLNGGVTPDAVIPLVLANGEDELILSNALFTLDQIAWDGGPSWPAPTGASMSLDPSVLDDLSNDLGGNWCEGTTAYGAGDLGTPGQANPSCSGGTTTGPGTGTGGTATGGGTGTGTGGTTGTATGGGTATGATGTATGVGTATGGSATGGTGTGTGTDGAEYAKLGCGCATGGGSGSWLVWLLPLLGLRRR